MTSLELALRNDLMHLQQRFANQLARADASGRRHEVLVSISTSTFQGSVLETVQPSERSVGRPDDVFAAASRFDIDTVPDSRLRRQAIMIQLAAFVLAFVNDPQVVVSATLQDTTDGDTWDYVTQCYMGSDNNLVIKEQTVEDRSNS